MPTLATSRLVVRSLSAALLLAAAGCTDDSGMMMTMDPPDGDPVDITPPQIVDTSPGADATGVAASAKITVTFSEQMDPATVEAAYSSEQLPLDKVSFQWNQSGTVLTISPDAPLEYAEGNGTDPTLVTPLTYGITIGTEAADLAGNPLDAPLDLSFATRRRMTALFPTDPDLTKAVLDTTVLAGVSFFIGDSSTKKRYQSYITFDISTLPAGSEVELAAFGGRQLAPYGAPYNLGPVVAQHLTFSSMENIAAVFPISLPGEFSTDATLESKIIDVTLQVQDDVDHRAERGDRSQYRLQIDQATNNDDVADTAVFQKDTFDLMVEYVVD